MLKSKNVLKVFLSLVMMVAVPTMVAAQVPFQYPTDPSVKPVDIAPLAPSMGANDSDWSAQGVGVLDPDAGGMGLDLWGGINATIAYHAMTGLPADLASPALRQAIETALISTARPPASTPDLPLDGRDFISLRANTLYRMGRSVSASRLIRAAGGLTIESRAGVVAKATLRQGLVQDACDWAKTYSNPDKGKDRSLMAFWARLNIVCAVAAGDADKARFLTALALEQGQVDGVFDQLVNAATVQPATGAPGSEQANRLTLPRPVSDLVEIALSDRARITAPLSEDPILRAMVLENQAPMMPVVDQDLRLRFALALARNGIIDRGGLDAVMASVGATTVLDGDPLAAAKASSYDKGLIILAAALGRDIGGADYPALWQEMAVRMLPWRGAVLERVAAWLDNITPTNGLQTDLNQIAQTAGLVRMAEGKAVEASRWLAAANNLDAGKTRLQLVPFEWLDKRFSLVSAEAWRDDVIADARLGPDYAQLALHLAEASGAVPLASIQPVLDTLSQQSGPLPSPLNQQDALLMLALEQAAGQQQKGMTLLLVAQGVGRNDPASIETGRMVAMVRALTRAGLEPTARQLSREVLIGRLLPSVAPPLPLPVKPSDSPAKKPVKPEKAGSEKAVPAKSGAKKP